ncbi:MAG: ABC transporter ATP-binding protein [Deltaproteobacteria bacterium]|nr:ABC transporter ATP-binding protein [Deltaproteobacteria bacterium]
MSDALVFVGVRKRYRRGVLALDDLSFRVPRGALCGFVGPNGAGKTTAFSVVCGFLRADAGKVDILADGPFDPWRFKGRLGVLPQDAELGDQHTPRELLAHLGRLQGLAGAASRREADRVLELVRLAGRRNKRIGTLSHGMRRRVAVASALVGDPDLVLLDEPMSGLDPSQTSSLRRVLLQRRPGQTVVVSSHDLNQLERICDWVVMLDEGRLVRQGTVAEVTGRSAVVEWVLGPGEVPLDALREAFPDHGWSLDDGVLSHLAPAGADLDAVSVVVAAKLAAAAVPIREVRRGVSLERSFLDETGD